MAETASAIRLRYSVAEEVRVAMVRKRVNGAALAVAIGRSQAYVSRRLTGDTAFDVDDLERIADALGVQVSDLLPRSLPKVTTQFPPTALQATSVLHRRTPPTNAPVAEMAARFATVVPGLRRTAPTGRYPTNVGSGG